MTTMKLEQWDIDIASNRDSITEWVRERKPAFRISNPQSRTMGHIRFIGGYINYRFENADCSCMSSLKIGSAGSRRS